MSDDPSQDDEDELGEELEPASAASLDEALRRLPLFPLPNVVLFPHALLPLHIFEDRYRAMVRDILSGARFLAVGLIGAEASEDDERPPVQPIAGVGEVVMAHELPDGRFNLVVRGRARIRIDQELASDRPYRLVSAHLVPDLPNVDVAELRAADQRLRGLIGRLADSIPEGGEILHQVVAAQQTPAELCDVVAAALIVDAGLRQQLLETLDIGDRIERVAAEVIAMSTRIGVPSSIN